MPVLPANLCKITTGFLDTVNDVGVASLVAGDISERSGQLGKIYEFTNAQALAHSSVPATQRLYCGWYQYVKAAGALSRGQIVSWDTFANSGWIGFSVLPIAAAANDGRIAGVALGTVTSGRYCFIQVPGIGLANVLFRAAITNAAIGASVFQLTATATADAIADATAVIGAGAAGLRSYLGVAENLPVNNTITLVRFGANIG
jgi:hypothetical protein